MYRRAAGVLSALALCVTVVGTSGPTLDAAAAGAPQQGPQAPSLFPAMPPLSPPATFHAYSVGFDSSASSYSGVKVYRKDLSLNPSTGCVYQPIWVGNAAYQTNELGSEYGGTSKGCEGANDTWYWGYQTNKTTFIPGGTRAMTPGQTHYFSIYYYLGYYYFYVDSTLMYDRYFNQYFAYADAGLESYDSAVSVAPFPDSSLQYTLSGGSWTNWSGEDTQTVNSPLCGRWISATDWQAGENQSSC